MRSLFVHFPKAGGTSVHTQLQAAFGARALADYDHDPLAACDARVAATAPDGIELVYGHMHPARYIDWSEFAFTFVREPIENLISIYCFWSEFSTATNSVHGRFLEERPGILEFARYYPVKVLLSNIYFGNFDFSRLDIIGFHDNRRRAIREIGDRLGVSLRDDFKLNITSSRRDYIRTWIRSDQYILSRLEDALIEDVRLYEKLYNRWS